MTWYILSWWLENISAMTWTLQVTQVNNIPTLSTEFIYNAFLYEFILFWLIIFSSLLLKIFK